MDQGISRNKFCFKKVMFYHDENLTINFNFWNSLMFFLSLPLFYCVIFFVLLCYIYMIYIWYLEYQKLIPPDLGNSGNFDLSLRGFLWLPHFSQHLPINVHQFNYRNTRKRCEICTRLTIKTPERCNWRRFSVVIVNFEHILHLFPAFFSF